MKHVEIILLLFLFISCKKTTKVLDYDISDNNRAQILPITIDDEGGGLLFSNIFSNVEYIHLETTEQSLVGVVSKLEIANNGDLIVLDKTKGSVIRFNDRGKYLCHIGRRGNGHGEYITASDIAYERYNNSVIVLDESAGKLLSYDINGKYLSSFQLGYSPSAFTVLDNNHMCLYMNHFDNLENRLIGYNFKIINRKGKLVSEFMEYDETMEPFHPNSENVFFTMDSKNCFRQPYSSLIYSVDNIDKETPNITPELYIDFGEKKIPQSWYRLDFVEMRHKLSETRDIMYLRSVYKNNNCLYLNLVKNKNLCLYIIDLKDRSLDKFGFYAHNDMYGFVSSVSLSTMKDNKCFFVFVPSNFDHYKNQINKKGWQPYTVDENLNPKIYIPSHKDKDLLNSIKDGDNPIIQVCTLKE